MRCVVKRASLDFFGSLRKEVTKRGWVRPPKSSLHDDGSRDESKVFDDFRRSICLRNKSSRFGAHLLRLAKLER